MAGLTYKCASCGGYLEFDPETQRWKCPYCGSVFDASQLTETDTQSEEKQPTREGSQLVYRCPSCGSEIVTDETTVATNCYYCHSPVVLQGKLSDDARPDTVLPFSIDREKALSTFLNWVKTKRYVPKDFFNQAQLEHLSGVYYPHYVTECSIHGTVDGEGRNVHVMETRTEVVTTTEHYHVHREADMTFRDVIRPALSKANRKLSDAIHPFPLNEEKPFSDAYLSGFLAERRDIGEQEVQQDVAKEVAGYVQPMLKDTMNYNSVSLTPSATLKRAKSRYVLLPTWVLTYPNKNDPQKPYYYAMNGRTGEVCGVLPIDKGKLTRTALLVGAAVFAVGCLISYFLV